MKKPAASPPDFGARIRAADRVQFNLWAPDSSSIMVAIDGQKPLPMIPAEGGRFTLEAPARPSSTYNFITNDGRRVTDPASRLQASDVHDASVVVGPDSYSWHHPDWPGRPWHETVLYELHPGACGGYEGIETMLPRLADLGITAIELMPIADFPGRHNWGYDGVLPYAPDRAYGTRDALKHLIDAAHGRGLMVFLDVVYNHFGPDGNYLGLYASSFFRDDIKTPWGSAIDYKKPQVRSFFIENALYWLNEFRFDGLRFDAVHAIGDNDFLSDMAREIRAGIAPHRMVHLVLENDDNNAQLLRTSSASPLYDAQWADDTHHCLHVLLTHEKSGYYEDYGDAATQLARCLSSGFAYQGEVSQHRDGARRGTRSDALPPSAFVAFLQNHDQIGNRALGERLTVLADHQALRAAILLLLLSPQIPLIFMGEEYGETSPFLYFTDHNDAALAAAVREGRRQEFSKFDGFRTEDAQLQIPDPNDPATFAASVPSFAQADVAPGSAWFAFYRAHMRLRHDLIIPRIEGARSQGAVALARSGVRAVWQMGDGAVLTIAANFGNDPLPCAAGPGAMIAASPAGAAVHGSIAPRAAVAWLASP
ncbi:malto-oligosyltrehalose trehalohydrolase [Acidiphilium sp.]|uniref:malto-oligosyltrehalose trehalohydrolase n=1 Tax=Acidiphilium sp. TaxID=527 RepID=UPI003CFF50FF